MEMEKCIVSLHKT